MRAVIMAAFCAEFKSIPHASFTPNGESLFLYLNCGIALLPDDSVLFLIVSVEKTVTVSPGDKVKESGVVCALITAIIHKKKMIKECFLMMQVNFLKKLF